MRIIPELRLIWMAVTAVLLWPVQARPANISLTNSDAFGTTSFNAKGNWNSSSAPLAGSSYSTAGFDLRTPPDTNSYTFAGNSLTAEAGGRIIWKGSGVITITNLILTGGSIVNGNNSSIQHAGSISIVADSYAQLTTPGGETVISADITSGTGSLTITNGNNATPGNGSITLNGNNIGWTGKLIISQGSQTNMPALKIDSEARLGGNPAVFAPDQLTLSNTILACSASFTINDANRGITIRGTNATIDTGSKTVTIAIPITGPANLSKAGTGILDLSGNNSYSGDTIVNAGNLRLVSSQALPSGSGKGSLNITSGGTVSMYWNDVTCNALTGSGTMRNLNPAAILRVGGTDASCTFSGSVIGESSTDYPIVQKVGSGTLTLAGTTDNAWAVAIVDGGTLVLAKSSSSSVHAVGYTGVTVNSGGLLRLAGTGGDQIFDGSGIQINGGLVDMNGRNEAVSYLSGAGGAISNGTAATLSTLTVGANNGSGTFGGTLRDGSGFLALTKTGTGTQTLSGVNTYSGTTVVNGGTLVVNGSVASGCLVSAGSTLAGTGSAAGIGNVSGTVEPGDPAVIGAAQFSTGPLTLNAGATLGFHLSGVTNGGPPFNDLLAVDGNLTLNGNTISISLLDTNLAVGAYRLVNYSGAKSGLFGPVVHNTRYTLTLDESVTNQVNLVISTGSGSDLRWTGASNAAWDVVTTTNWLNTASSLADAFMNLDRVLFDDTPSVPTNVTLSAVAYPAAITVKADTNNFSFSGSGSISGGGGITKLGISMLTISNANDFTGPAVIKAGTVRVGNDRALGASSGVTTIEAGATLDVNGFNLGAEAVIASGGGVNGQGAIVNNGSGQQIKALRYVTMAGDTTVGGVQRWDIRAPDFWTSTNGFLSSGGQPYNLTVNMDTTVPGFNPQFSLVSVIVDPALGDINVMSGGFSFELNSTSLGNPTKILAVASNAWFQLWDVVNPLDKRVILTNGSWFGATAGTQNKLVNETLLPGGNVAIWALSNCTMTVAGPITGAGGFTKTDPGLLVLSGTNSYTGGTLISDGTLQLGNGGVGGDSGTGPITNNGTLQFNRSDDFIWPLPVTGDTGHFVKLNTNTVTLAATNEFWGAGWGGVQIDGGVLRVGPGSQLSVGGEFDVGYYASTGRCEIAGGTVLCTNWIAIGSSDINARGELVLNSGSLVKRGMGDIVMGSVISTGYLGGHGTLTVNGGMLYNNSLIRLGEYTGARGYFNLNGGMVQARNILKASQATEGTARFNGGCLQAIANEINYMAVDAAWIQAGGLMLDDAGFAITNNQPLLADTTSLGGGLTKLGTGTLTLTASNTFTGPILLTAGSLSLKGNASVVSSSLISVAPATTLNATGLVSGALTIPASQSLAGYGTVLGNLGVNGTLIPGNTNDIGVLTASNNVTLAGNTLMEIARVPGTLTNDLLRGVATLTCGGTLTVTTTNSSADFTDGDTFKLFNASSYTGGFTNVVLPDFSPCLSWDASKLAVDGTLKLVAAANRPSITQQPVGRPVLPATAVTLQVQTTGGTVTNYQWYFNGLAIPNQTNRTFTITSMDATNFGAYSVLVSGGVCSTLSQAASLVPVVPPSLVAPVFVDPVMLVSFTSQVGPTYVVEYTDVLPAVGWTLLSTRAGTGGTITVVDTAPSATGRFYRIRMQ